MNTDTQSPRVGAKKVLPEGMRRGATRFELKIGVGLYVLIPEEGFEPRHLSGICSDVSNRGMRVCIDELPLKLYTKLLSRTRGVRVELSHPVSGEPLNLNGKLAWIDYHKPRADDLAGSCQMGVFFNDSNDDMSAYNSLIDSIESR